MNDWRNPDGTYNGIKMLADLSGLSRAEVAWTAKRLQQLMAAGSSKAEAKAIVKTEAAEKPWERPPP